MMKRLLLFALLALFVTGLAFTQTNFTLSTVRQVEHPKLDEQFRAYQTVQLDHDAFYRYYQETEGDMQFDLQTDQRRPLRLNIAPYELRSTDFKRFTANDGRVRARAATRTSVYRGSVQAADGSTGEAIFTFDEQYVLGRWDEGETTYFLEPLWRFVPDADRSLYVQYRAQDAIMPPNFCATAGADDHGHDHTAEAPAQRSVGECLEVELAIASDFELFQDLGNATSVENFMLNNLANVQTDYDDEFDDEILFVVVTTYIATCSAPSCDPWTNNTNAGTLLDSFRSWGQSGGFGVTFDVATLWTGRDFNGGTIGVAWLDAVCTSLRYNTCQNFSSNSQRMRVLWSHELGHNFSARHDNSGVFIMSPSVNSSTNWSNQSQNSINNFVASISCLSSCASAAPPTAFVEASIEEACTGSYVAYFDESEGNVTDRFWDFPGGTPSFSTDPHPIVFYPDPGFYTAFLTVENAQGDDFASFDVEIELDDNFRKVIHYANFEDGFDGWFVENPDNDVSWERREVDGNLGNFAAFIDNHDYNEPGETDGLLSPPFDFSGEAQINLELEYAYARYNNNLRDQLRIYVSTDGGNSFPDLIFEGDENGTGNFATANDQTGEFTPGSTDDWCGAGPGCINLDLSAYAGQSDVAILIENVNGWGNNMYVDNIAVTSACGAVEPPTANFSQNTTVGCAPLIVEFQDESVGVITEREWTFNGGNPDISFEQNPFTEYNFPGVYDVTLYVANNLGGDTYTQEDAVTVLGSPDADFTFTNAGLTYNFVDASSADVEDWAWDFGDGNFSFEQNPTHAYSTPGTYEVTLEVFNDCGSTSVSQTIVVEPVLRADFISTEAVGCAPLEVKFIDLSEGEPTAWSWEFPGGAPSTSTEQNPTIIYGEPGIYDVTLTVTANGETDVITMTGMVDVLPLPTAAFTATIAPGEATPTIVNLSTNATSYLWDFGNGETSTEETPSITYDEGDVYTITLTAFNECGQRTTTQTVEVIFPVSPSFTLSAASGCVPFTTTFTAAPQAPGLSYEWTFPGGSPATSTEANPSVTYETAGSYDVTLTITNAAGPATITETSVVTINEGPTAAFTAQATPGSLTVSLTDQSTNADNLSWNFGDGNTDTGAITSYTYAAAGTYTITLTAENECGTDVATQEVTLILPVDPSITATTTDGCTPLVVDFSANPQLSGQTYEWTFPGGQPGTSTDPNPTVTYDTPGTFDVTLTITNAAGPASTTEIGLVTVGQGPTAAFTINSTLGEAGISLNNSSTDADSFIWDFSDGSSSTDMNPMHTYTEEGTYEIMLVAANECGTDTTIQEVEIIFVPDPTITASVNGGCAPVTVVYEAEPQGDGYTYSWEFPGGTPSTSEEAVASVTYSEPGMYAATLTVTNAAGSATTTSEMIEVLAAPSVSFTADNPLGEGTVNFTSTSENVTNLSWNFGDGTMGTGSEVSHTYITAGTYEVTLTGTGPCGEATSTQTVTIVFPPAGGFTSNGQMGCAPFAVSFTANDQGEGFTYDWSFPGGEPSTSTAANPTVTYTAAGTYDVLLTVSNAAGTEMTTEEALVTVGEAPPASIDLTTTLGSLAVTVIGPSDSSVDSWAWNFGDGTQASGNPASHTYASSGTYTIQLTTTNDCGSNLATTEVTILTAPTATFTANALSVCPGATVMLQADETEGVTHSWDIPGGDPSSSTEAMVMTSFAEAGSYDVSLSATNAAGTTTTTQTIIVNPLPVADFSFEVNGLTATFTNLSENATTYSWLFPNAEDSSENPEYTFPGVGSYEVTLLAENACGTDTRTVTVVIEGEIPNLNFTAENNEGCGSITVNFTSDIEGADEIQWSFPGGTPSTSTDPNPVVTYDEPGEYTVTLTATNAFGTNALTQENIVVVFEPLSAEVSHNLVVTTATFSAVTTGVEEFTWTFPDGSTSMEAEPSYTFPGNGTYPVIYDYSGPCGTGSNSVEVVIAGELPVVNITLDQTQGCAPFTVTYTDGSTNDPESWSWSFPGASPEVGTGAAVTVTYETPGIYSMTVDVTNAYGTTTMEMTDVVEVLAAPVAPGFTSTTADDINFAFTVTDPVADWTYSWDFGDGTQAGGEAVTHTYTENNTYEVTLTVTNDCGEASSTEMVVAIVTSTNAPAWAVGLQLAPNPTPGVLLVNAQSWPGSGVLRYRLVNALGQNMTTGQWSVGAGNWRQTLDMNRLPAGTYWLQLGWDEETWTQKVIKQ